MITGHSEAQLAAYQATMRQQAREARERAQILNQQALEVLVAARMLPWNGQMFDVAPVPARVGAQMDLALARIGQHDDSNSTPTPAAVREIAEQKSLLIRLFKRLVQPRGWRLYVWRLLPNPFRNCTDAQFLELCAFFFACRMSDGVRPSLN